ncbi:Hypothetical predicted protein [Podarcis lilfordi]|uniref:Uncharacterized protein n=1 Tax=Podarcis lilfordi TaxID=74358 RepID=A0AA35JKY7_9SAUR|nr:Hypothetical predicted protein [Podarcis lilfordi]
MGSVPHRPLAKAEDDDTAEDEVAPAPVAWCVGDTAVTIPVTACSRNKRRNDSLGFTDTMAAACHAAIHPD